MHLWFIFLLSVYRGYECALLLFKIKLEKLTLFEVHVFLMGFFFAMLHTSLTFMSIHYKLFKNDYCRHKLINLKTTIENSLLVFNSIFSISKIHFMHFFNLLIISLLGYVCCTFIEKIKISNNNGYMWK